jgi:hypothetical protein
MNTNGTDFVQPPATMYLGDVPQRGIFYVWHSMVGAPSQYCIATGERMKNGKHIVYIHDVFCGPRKKVVKVGMCSTHFAQWKRAEIVPARAYRLLSEALSAK